LEEQSQDFWYGSVIGHQSPLSDLPLARSGAMVATTNLPIRASFIGQ
jgi:hypothetical protein